MSNKALVRGIVTLAVLAGAFAPFGPSQTALATPPATDNIGTCADLQALGTTPSAAADTINLTADLDCNGVSFTAMFGGGFTGTFNGQGHSISNLNINMPGNFDVGLFSNAAGATIENLVLASGSVTGSNATGALVGQVDDITVTNVTSNVDVNSIGSQVGGLIGMLQGPGTTLVQDVTVTGDITDPGTFGGGYVAGLIGFLSAADGDTVTLRRVAYTGTVSAAGGSRTGGLLGVAFVTGDSAAAAVTIEDSYNAGAVDTTENEVGGIIGSAIAIGNGATSIIDLTRVYNSGAVTGTDGVGGLYGIANSTNAGDAISITDSFATGLVTDTVANGGGLLGSNSADPPTVITTTNSFYASSTGQTICASLITPTGTCTRIDTGAQPNYFKANHANAPLNAWDFAATWVANPGAYPTLIPADDGDGIGKADESAGPNAGDANGDGTPDAAQASVAGFPDSVSGHYAVLQTSCGALFNVQVGAENTTAGQTDVAYTYPGGLVQFVVTGCTPGATATITQYFYGLSNPGQFVMRKSDPGAHTYTTVPGAAFSVVTIGGQSALKIVYQITDGSALDQDGAADGNIVDPAGPGVGVIGAPDTGLGALSRH